MHLSRNIAIFRRPALLALLALAALSASRLLLVSELWARVEPTGGLLFILLQGIRFDLIVVAQLFGPVFLLSPWLHSAAMPRRIGAWLVPAYLAAVCALGFFVEASTLAFLREFDIRPNYLFVEYLGYPREMFAMLTGSHLRELVVFTAIAGLLGWKVFRWLRRDPALDLPVPWSFSWVATPIVAVVVALTVRSTLDHRPINPGNAAFSTDSMVNQLALNSPYALLYDLYERRRDRYNQGVRYGDMSEEETLAVILEEAGISPGDMSRADIPTLRFQEATYRRERPLNLVIVVQESLGAEFVGGLGGEDLTPEIDSLADEGIWLERLYATGIRSVRGIETVVTGFPPTPRLAVVKLAETQTGFFTLPGLLSDHGYDTQFFYGGRAHFDNMQRFFLNNGFRSIVDQSDFEAPEWVGAWGVSDEDLLRRAHQTFAAAGDQPFFAVIFTTTHHAPFEIPEGKVPEAGPAGKRGAAVRYADFALGRFLDLARGSDYWNNTLFYVTADHNSRVYGDQLVPVQRFHIPGVIVGGPVEARRIPGIASQIDMLPTLLSLIGVDGEHPSIGRDLTRPEFRNGAGRAMMQFNRLQAYLENDRVVVLAPDKAPRFFRLQAASGQLFSTAEDDELARRALAYATWGPLTIRNKAYRNR